MAPIWHILLILILLVFGVPLLLQVHQIILEDLTRTWGVAPGQKGCLLCLMLILLVVALFRINCDRK